MTQTQTDGEPAMADHERAKEVLAAKRRLWELPDEDMRVCFTEHEFNAVNEYVSALEEAAKTQAVKAIALEAERDRLREALGECEEFFDQRADAEYFTDSPTPVANEEMRLLGVVRAALNGGGDE